MCYLIILLLLFSFPQENPLLIGEWKLRSFDTIDKIRASPGYIFSDDATREVAEAQFKLILEYGGYNFTKDTLYYTTLKGIEEDYRKALWSVRDNIISVTDLADLRYSKDILIRSVSKDSLVLSFLVDGDPGDGSMIFTRK